MRRSLRAYLWDIERAAHEGDKMALVADIDTIQSQLAKPQPNRNIVGAAWEVVRGAAAIKGCAEFVQKVAHLIGAFLS